jgi:hypothetical protein
LAPNQIAAQDEEEINTNPAETIDSPGQFESEKRRVIYDHHDNRERAKEIEARLAFAMYEARIDRSFGLVGHHL